MPPKPIHGTRRESSRQHPVLDLDFWINKGPMKELPSENFINGPVDIALAEQARERAGAHANLGPSAPADIFVWALDSYQDSPWLTRLGGRPWREAELPWPKDAGGKPLTFLGQICFVDSLDIVGELIPGEVALFFGRYASGHVYEADLYLEWSRMSLKEPCRDEYEYQLPFCYVGVIHRTVQYWDDGVGAAAFAAIGWKGTYAAGLHTVQATCIGSHAAAPQRFDTADTLAMLSFFNMRGEWPLCDVLHGLQTIRSDGQIEDVLCVQGAGLTIGDAGAIWIDNNEGCISLESASA